MSGEPPRILVNSGIVLSGLRELKREAFKEVYSLVYIVKWHAVAA